MEAYDRKLNLKLIDQLRNLEKVSLDHYIENVLLPLQNANPSFYFTLYKDINFVINNSDIEGDDNIDSTLENNNERYQTRLHDISIWLHLELLKQLNIESLELTELSKVLKAFDAKIAANSNYTPEYKTALLEIRKSFKKELELNYDRNEFGIKKYLDLDVMLDLVKIRPNIMGIELDINGIIDRFRNK